MQSSFIFKGLASLAIVLLLAAPARAYDDESDFVAEDLSQSPTTVREITRTATVAAVQAALDAILDRNAALYGFAGAATAETGATGASGGNGGAGVGVWISSGWQYMDTSGSQWSRGGLTTVTGGIDKKIGNAVVGVAVGGEWLRLKMSESGKFHYDGFSLTPYCSYALQPTLVLDAAMGLGWQDNYQKSTYFGSDGQWHNMNDTYDSWRLFTSAGLSKYWSFDNWVVSGRLGAMYLHQNASSYTLRGEGVLPFANDFVDVSKNTTDLFQLSLGGRVGYRLGNFNPFVGVTYVQDVAKSGRQRDFVGVDFQLGCTYRAGNFSLGLTGTYGVRQNSQKIGGMLNFRLEF